MASNIIYISAGLVPKGSTAEASNTCYISAGLIPDDTAAAESTFIPKIIMF